MKLTVVVEDNIIGIDGDYRQVVLPPMKGIRAVQFDGSKGNIEGINYSNTPILSKNFSLYQQLIDLWKAAATTNDDKSVEDEEIVNYDSSVKLVLSTFKPADKDSIDLILNKQYHNLILDKYIRNSDAAVIGIHITKTSGIGNDTGLLGLLSLRSCIEDCLKLGLPALALINTEQEYITNEELSDYLLSASPLNKIIFGPKTNFVYQEWTLELAKLRKLALIKSERNFKEASGFPYMGSILDSDERSVQRITAAALAASVALSTNQPMLLNWTAQDNTSIEMTAQDILGMPVALSIYASTLHEEARLRKELVLEANSMEELEAI